MGVGTGLYMYDAVVKKFMFAISSPDEFLVLLNVKVMDPYSIAQNQFQQRETKDRHMGVILLPSLANAICYRPSVCRLSVCRL